MAETAHLVQDHAAHLGHVVDDLEAKVKGSGTGGFVGRVVPDGQVAVLQRFFDADSLRRVEGQHFVQKVQSVGVGAREELLEGDLGHVRQVAHVFLGARRAYAREGCFAGRAEKVQDLVQLVDVVAALEEWFAAEQLGENAAYGPDVDYRVLALAPMRRDVQIGGTHWLWCMTGSSA